MASALFGVTVFFVAFFLAMARILFGPGLALTLRQNLHFLAGGKQGVLCGTNGLQARRPFGHFERFLEGLDGFRVFRALGQQAHGRQTDLALGGQALLRFVQCLNVLQDHAIGKSGLDRIGLMLLKLQTVNFFLGGLNFLHGFFQGFLRLFQLLGQFGQVMHHMFFTGKAPISQTQCRYQQHCQ